MGEQTTSELGQAPATGGQPQGQAPAVQGQAPATQQSTGPDLTAALAAVTDPAARDLLSRQLADLTETRREAARYRTERAALAEKVTAYEQAQMTESQRLQAERDALATERDQLAAQIARQATASAVTTAAAAAQAHNPAAVEAMISSRIVVGADGQPTNVDALVAELKTTDPYLFRQVSADANRPGTPGGAGMTMNDQIRRAARGGSGRL